MYDSPVHSSPVGRLLGPPSPSELTTLIFVSLSSEMFQVLTELSLVTDSIQARFGVRKYHIEESNAHYARPIPFLSRIFVLLIGMDHNVRIFDGLPRGMFEDETPSLPPIFRLPAPRLTYQGGVELQVSHKKECVSGVL